MRSRDWSSDVCSYDLVFGEFYWDISENLKLTSGLRLTEDRKVATRINSQLLLGTGPIGGGFVSQGYRISPDIKQKWTRLTGRLVLDWKPEISFTDDRSEEHMSELQSLMRISYAVFCLKKKTNKNTNKLITSSTHFVTYTIMIIKYYTK